MYNHFEKLIDHKKYLILFHLSLTILYYPVVLIFNSKKYYTFKKLKL